MYGPLALQALSTIYRDIVSHRDREICVSQWGIRVVMVK
jgi:hypothetical protein